MNYPNGCFHVSIEGCPLLYYLFLREICLLEIEEELVNNLISFLFLLIPVIWKIPWNGHLYLCRPNSHLEYEFVKIYVLRPDRIGGSVVSDEIEFELDDSEHRWLKHIFEEHAFLWVNKLIIAIFEYFVAMNILDVEVSIEPKPFLILSFIF